MTDPPPATTSDERLVAAELAELDLYTGQQARAEAALLRMLPIERAAAILRDEALDALAGKVRPEWSRYLLLESALARHHGWEERWRDGYWPSMWNLLDLGDEPEPLRWMRRGVRRTRTPES